MPKPSTGLWLTTALWILSIGGLWAGFDYQLEHGTEIALKTVPIDPRDLLRGDFVVLRYDISTPATDLSPAVFAKNARVYVPIEEVEGRWTVREVLREPPGEGLYLRGRIRRSAGPTAEIVYGIESFFVPEGEGKKYEEARNRDRLWAVVSVSPHGMARLKRLEIRE